MSVRQSNLARRGIQQSATYQSVSNADTQQYKPNVASGYDADSGRSLVSRNGGTVGVRAVGQTIAGATVVSGNGFSLGSL